MRHHTRACPNKTNLAFDHCKCVSMSICYRYIRHINFPAKINITFTAKTPQHAKLLNRSCHTNYLFDESPHRNVYSLNRQLASYTHMGDFLATWNLFSWSRCASFELDSYTFTPVLAACCALPGEERGKQVHTLMIKMGADLGTVIKTALIDMYQKCGCLSDSIKVFEEIQYKDAVAWNALLSGFVKHGLANEALGVFGAMMSEGVKFSEFTLCSVLKACTLMKAFHQGKQVHGMLIVMSRDLVVLSTALIDFYSGLGYIHEAMKVFSSLSWRKDDVICNSMIAAGVKNRRYKEAFSIMKVLRPNTVALTSALAACSENSDPWIGMQIHCVAIRFDFMSNTQLCNVLLDMYAKSGRVVKARTLFDRISSKTVVSWTSMIDAYGRHGHGREALELFKKMGEVGGGILPNPVTFLAVLSACGHSGLVEEGKELFYLARERYGLDPGFEHYCCFIDILGRAGLIEDVWSLYHDMVKNGTTKPTSEIWAAILNACHLNEDFSRGEIAAKHLLESESNNPSNYVLLSNFYASIGRWDVADSLRNNLREKDLNKEAGSSWVAIAHCHGSASQLNMSIA